MREIETLYSNLFLPVPAFADTLVCSPSILTRSCLILGVSESVAGLLSRRWVASVTMCDTEQLSKGTDDWDGGFCCRRTIDHAGRVGNVWVAKPRRVTITFRASRWHSIPLGWCEFVGRTLLLDDLC